MPQIDASVSSDSDIAIHLSKTRMASENRMNNFTIDANAMRKPDYFVYIFNVSPKSFEVHRPPLMPRVNILGVEKGQRYRMACKLPNIVNQCWQDADTGQPRVHGFEGERVAMDIINAANTGLDQDLKINPKEVFGQGVDLSRWGVFFSLNEVPTEEEIAKNIAKLEATYRQLLQEADDFAREGKYNLIMPDHRVAADHFRHKASWNTRVEVPEDCPLCGGPVKKGVAIHSGSDGCGGVLNWKKAVQAGLRKAKDCPDQSLLADIQAEAV